MTLPSRINDIHPYAQDEADASLWHMHLSGHTLHAAALRLGLTYPGARARLDRLMRTIDRVPDGAEYTHNAELP